MELCDGNQSLRAKRYAVGADRTAAAGQGLGPGADGRGQPLVRQRGLVGSAFRRHWRDLPERYGKWKTLHKRFTRWAKAGVWERVFASLIKDRNNQYLMLDSTLVRAHQQAATGKGGLRPGSGALPRRTDHQDPHGRRPVRPPGAL